MELLAFWVITDSWQITTEMLKELFRAQPLGFAVILSHSKILVVAALWGGIQEMQQFLSEGQHPFCPQGFLLLSSCYSSSSGYEGLHQEGKCLVVCNKIAAARVVPAVICVTHLNLSHRDALFIKDICKYVTALRTYGQ